MSLVKVLSWMMMIGFVNLGNVLDEERKRDQYLLNNEKSSSSSSTTSSTPIVVSSSRWNPTVEQLRILEELYRRGTRTPSADQIQHITAQLRRFGKIEGKNVFYWFQNHKARERQKRRRQTAADQTKYSGKTIFIYYSKEKEIIFVVYLHFYYKIITII